MHDQEKWYFFMGNGPSFFPKAGFEKRVTTPLIFLTRGYQGQMVLV
jgi:hypothetical protein